MLFKLLLPSTGGKTFDNFLQLKPHVTMKGTSLPCCIGHYTMFFMWVLCTSQAAVGPLRSPMSTKLCELQRGGGMNCAKRRLVLLDSQENNSCTVHFG